MPPGSELEHFAPRTPVVILFLVVSEIRLRKLLVWGRVMAGLGGKPRVALAKLVIWNIGVKLFVSAGLKILFAVVITIPTQDLTRKIVLSEPNGFRVRFGALQHRCHMPVVLSVAK